MSAKTVLCCLLAQFSLVLSTSVVYHDCGSKTGKISALDVTPCPQEPCVLKKGSNVTTAVSFNTNESVTKASAVVYGVVLGVKVPYPIDNPDGCKDSGLTCPLKSGGSYTYKSAINVLKSFPAIKVVVWWQLNDQDGNVIWCFEIPIEVVE